MSTPVTLIDAFTKTSGQGNRAGVVLDAEHLTPEQMQKIASIVNVSETAFVLPAKDPSYDLEVRYFTPTQEVPVCGHATIATHYLLAYQSPQKNIKFRTKTGVGILSIETQEIKNYIKVIMTQGQIIFEPVLANNYLERICRALRISPKDLVPSLPIQIVSTGHSKVIIPLHDKTKLDTLQPDFAELRQLSHEIGSNGYFPFVLDQDPKADILLYGRMFAPAIGINEDPVTGNAHGPAGAYLVYHEIIKPQDNLAHYYAVQGEAISKRGIVEIFVHTKNATIEKVQIAGVAVIADQITVNASKSRKQ